MIVSFAIIAQINVCCRGYINVIYGAVRLLRSSGEQRVRTPSDSSEHVFDMLDANSEFLKYSSLYFHSTTCCRQILNYGTLVTLQTVCCITEKEKRQKPKQ